MMTRFLLFITLCLAWTACSSEKPEILTACTRDEIGNYIVKWEVSPLMDGVVNMYVSDNPEDFDFSSPVGSYKIADGVATYITDDNFNRKFFCLTFNGKYPQIVSARFVSIAEAQNFRDMGGYQTTDNRTIRWGKIYRSGTIFPFTEWDSSRLENIHLRTLIDLRPQEAMLANPVPFKNIHVVSLPVPLGNQSELDQRINRNHIRKGDGLLFMQDLYLQFVSEDKAQFSQALDVFTHEENYPILFCCLLGKDQTGFLAAMLLSALDVPKETILQDYTDSNQYIDPLHFSNRVAHLNQETQEAVTVLVSARESFLDLAFQKIEKDYGSVQNYLQNELGMTKEKQARLRELLLY